ncbi:hypothetical protein K435DRAFT_965798 [Dendrothele bispora CBS 962.96]|uniref:DUF6534 domain-containing protein n=1 Tax=Dendrothele bispora (strain CBS 962.96) TaxID=1314807 RepID=A0A4S8M3T1_DENBC|nr:hypothetical protein K435DRAFT_965798 [Dendrothele bispora CBS 962.96]
MFRLWNIVKLQTTVKTTFIPMVVLRVAIDLLVCGCLSITLHESRTEIPRRGQLINTLIIYALNRFILTTMTAMGMAIPLIVNPKNVGIMTIEGAIVHVYINSFLATLNSRKHLRDMATSNIIGDKDMPMSRIKSSRNTTTLDTISFPNSTAASGSKHFGDVDITITHKAISEMDAGDSNSVRDQKGINVV